MTGYSGTPLWKKLGYKDGMTAHIDGVPAGYVEMLQFPPEISVKWAARTTPQPGFVHLFITSKSGLKAKLHAFRKTIHPDGVVWVSWPKKSSGVTTDLTEDVIRDIALPLGFVDIKVCAVDDVWSGLKLMIRKKLR